ncbi:MAG: hypothetical protein QMB98_02045 [Flaviflexus sp.]|uniref:hypothetical protein n=1 Tax=Flaviflexus sp. TaxID=1969482 RepID=UPI00352C2A12
MKIRKFAAALSVGFLAASCSSGSGSDSEERAQDTELTTGAEEPEGSDESSSSSPSSTGEDDSTDSELEPNEKEETAEGDGGVSGIGDVAEDDEPEDEGPEISERGYLVKDVGDRAGVQDPADPKELMAGFILTDIEVGVQCTNPEAQPSKYGTHIALTFEVETSQRMETQLWNSVMISHHYIDIYPDGGGEAQRFTGGTGPLCLTGAEKLPDEIPPGTTAQGKVVIDSEVTSGIITYEMMGVPGGWEWTF